MDKPKESSSQGGGDESHLGRLERELYAREEAPELATRANDVSELGLRREKLSNTPDATATPSFVDVRSIQQKRRRRIFYIILGVLFFGALLAGGVATTIWYRLRQNVTNEQVTLTVVAPQESQAGESLTYEVRYGNASYVDWENVEVDVELPTGLSITATEPELPVTNNHIRRQVGSLPSGTTDSFTVTGHLLAEENASVVATAEIQLTPENFPSGRFKHSALASTVVLGAPLDVAVAVAREAGVGERVAAVITVTNKSNATMDGVYVALDPAVGMKLATEDAEFGAGFEATEGIWEVSSLPSLSSVSLTAILFVEGQPTEQRVLDIVAGLQRGDSRFIQQRASSIVTISSSELAVDQTYQSAASPLVVKSGEKVQGVIHYANVGTSGLKNVVVRAKIEGDSFDPATLKLRSGAYDPVTGSITWTSATVSELALLQPQQRGEIPYEFSVKPAARLPAEPASKNSTILITAFVDSPDVPVPVGQERVPVQNQYVMSVESEITLAADAFYDDGRLGIASEGPTPPEVGQQTTYSVRLRLGSTLNDLGDVKVQAILPDGVRYTGKNVATVGSMEFEERTGEILWSVPQVAGLTGRAAPTADLYFQVAILPGENQKGNILPFLNRLVATATDLFVDKELTFEVTTYPTTESAVPGKGKIQ